jgi:hypothetical protein
MPRIDNQTVLVTGASAGIGREIARYVAHRAGHVLLVARRTERLNALRDELTAQHDVEVTVAAVDLSEWDATAEFVQSLPEVDVLVNNAGFGHNAPLPAADLPTLRQMVQVNVIALTQLTHQLLPPMIERGTGGVLNIGSGAGFVSMPGAATYSGTKHYVHGFSEALRQELAGTGVTVTEVCPGPVRTEFSEVAQTEDADGNPEGDALGSLQISAAQCARESIDGFENGTEIVFPGNAYRGVMTVQGLLPRPLQRWLAQTLFGANRT